jgi:hypothetical protein
LTIVSNLKVGGISKFIKQQAKITDKIFTVNQPFIKVQLKIFLFFFGNKLYSNLSSQPLKKTMGESG